MVGLKRRGSVEEAASYRDVDLEVVVSSSVLPIAATNQGTEKTKQPWGETFYLISKKKF